MDASLRTTAEPRAVEVAGSVTPSTVVVPLDGSPAAAASLPVARWLCATLGASLQRVTVDVGQDDAVGLVDADGEVEYVLHGSGVGSALTDHLERQPAPLLCMASRVRGGLQRRLSGNLVDHLVAGARCPVVVVGPACEAHSLGTPPATLLLAASEHLPEGSAVLVGRWAMAMDADVVVATVVPPAVPATSAGPRDARRGGAHRRQPQQEGFLGGLTSLPADQHHPVVGPLVAEITGMGIAAAGYALVGGTVATSLLAFAESLPHPVLVVAPVGERDGRVPGDVTHQLLQRGRWPVLASLGARPTPEA